jgi:hypothetical protein
MRNTSLAARYGFPGVPAAGRIASMRPAPSSEAAGTSISEVRLNFRSFAFFATMRLINLPDDTLPTCSSSNI